MQRTEREVTDIEMIDALNEIIDLIIDVYNNPMRPEYENETRATQLGHDIVHHLTQRELLDRFSKIGYDSQRILLREKIIKTGGIKGQQEMDI